jgi:two-component sensor histidine kinase
MTYGGDHAPVLGSGDDVAFPDCARDCRLRSEADHRVANHLAILSAFVTLKAGELERAPNSPSPASVRILMRSVDAQIRAIARLHRMMMSGGANTSVDLASLLHEVCESFAGDRSGRITIGEDLSPDCLVEAERALPISQIVSECVTNATKHAYPRDVRGAIAVRCYRAPDRTLVVEVSDDGIGVPPAPLSGQPDGFGLRLMAALAAGVKGRLSFDRSEPGLTVRLTLAAADDPHMQA